MSYIHYTPGRVRFKFAELRNQQSLTSAIEGSIRQLDGVSLVQTNTITGSLLVHYDVRDEREKTFLSAIHDVHCKFGLASKAQGARSIDAKLQSAPAIHTDALVDTLLSMVIEKALERSTMALIGALI
jgi:hypothetical protein